MALTDFFVASQKELREVPAAKLPGKFKTYRTKNVDVVELGTLSEILTGAESLPELVVSVTEQGPWVYEVPRSVIEAISGLDEKKLNRTAISWAKTEEFVAIGATVTDAETILKNLRELATASEGKKRIYLWTRL